MDPVTTSLPAAALKCGLHSMCRIVTEMILHSTGISCSTFFYFFLYIFFAVE